MRWSQVVGLASQQCWAGYSHDIVKPEYLLTGDCLQRCTKKVTVGGKTVVQKQECGGFSALSVYFIGGTCPIVSSPPPPRTRTVQFLGFEKQLSSAHFDSTAEGG